MSNNLHAQQASFQNKSSFLLILIWNFIEFFQYGDKERKQAVTGEKRHGKFWKWKEENGKQRGEWVSESH